MRIVNILSTWAMTRPVNVRTSFDDPRGLTGSETGCIQYAQAFARAGHDVTVRGRFVAPFTDVWGVRYEQEHTIEHDGAFDIACAWTDPRPLKAYTRALHRVFHQQVNDFDYCQGWEQYTTETFSPSANHRAYIRRFSAFPLEKWHVGYNGIDPGLYFPQAPVNNHRIIYASSPDRGLHWLLEMFPKIKAQVPDAELHVYYDWKAFYERFRGFNGEMASRLRYCAEMFRRAAPHGVHHHASVGKNTLREAMRQSRVLAYPCDPVSYTEGFSVTTCEAAALGCVPVIVGSDALPEVYGTYLDIIPAPFQQHRDAYLAQLVRMLTDDLAYGAARERAADVRDWYGWDRLARDWLSRVEGL